MSNHEFKDSNKSTACSSYDKVNVMPSGMKVFEECYDFLLLHDTSVV